MEHYFEKEFKNLESLTKGEYEQCVFLNCNFEKANFNNFVFTECRFRDANLSMVKLMQTRLDGIEFKNCKLMGTDFENVNELSLKLHFDSCVLDHCIFSNLKAKAPEFIDCRMWEVDFSNADLSNAVFKSSDLSRAVFDNTNLTSADFSLAFNFTIDPDKNKLTKAKFSRSTIEGLLTKHKIQFQD